MAEKPAAGVIDHVTEMVAIDRLRTHPHNPRRGNLEVIGESIAANGFYGAVVAQRSTGYVLAGNHRLLAAHGAGLKEIPVMWVDVDDDRAARILLADNRTNDLASYDDACLAELLQSLPDLDGTGYDDHAVDELLQELGIPAFEGRTDPDDAPDLPDEPITAPGDLWILGEHRLLCGDAGSVDDVRRAIGDRRPAMVWTDPPYGVSYVGKTKDALKLSNDSSVGLEELLTTAFSCIDEVLKDGSAIYVCHPAGPAGLTFMDCFVARGWRLHQSLVWVKDSLVLGHADYHYRHEPILYGYKPGPGRRGRGAVGWYGDNAQSSVIEVARPKKSSWHPTMKPVGLIDVALANSSRSGDTVLDPFLGSGSSLIAAQGIGRRLCGLEIDPRYVDVAVARWEAFTGEGALRHG